jgi:hypothetical protein
MHANISTTDGIYGILPHEDKKQLLSTFDSKTADGSISLGQKIDEILAILKQNTPE